MRRPAGPATPRPQSSSDEGSGAANARNSFRRESGRCLVDSATGSVERGHGERDKFKVLVVAVHAERLSHDTRRSSDCGINSRQRTSQDGRRAVENKVATTRVVYGVAGQNLEVASSAVAVLMGVSCVDECICRVEQLDCAQLLLAAEIDRDVRGWQHWVSRKVAVRVQPVALLMVFNDRRTRLCVDNVRS